MPTQFMRHIVHSGGRALGGFSLESAIINAREVETAGHTVDRIENGPEVELGGPELRRHLDS